MVFYWPYFTCLFFKRTIDRAALTRLCIWQTVVKDIRKHFNPSGFSMVPFNINEMETLGTRTCSFHPQSWTQPFCCECASSRAYGEITRCWPNTDRQNDLYSCCLLLLSGSVNVHQSLRQWVIYLVITLHSSSKLNIKLYKSLINNVN